MRREQSGGRSRALRVLPLAAVLLLCGCSDWFFGGDNKKPLPGDRVSVLSFDKVVEPDKRLAGTPVQLPAAVENDAWPQAGAVPSHAIGQLALGEGVRKVWSTSIGTGRGGRRTLLSAPIVAEGKVFTMDARDRVRALLPATGAEVWSVDPTPDEERDGFGGGIAYDSGRLFVTTGFGQLVALEAQTGKELWRHTAGSPMRAAPTVFGGLVFGVTVDNRTEALDAATGEQRWSHTGISETAGLLGGSSPAVDAGTVLAPYSSGELFALKRENGRLIWSDSLTVVRRTDVVSTLADIKGLPVVDRGRVYAVSHSGRMAAIDLRTGNRIWDLDVGGVQTPWVAGDYVFVLGNNNELVCATREGRVRWVRQLSRYRNEERKRDPIFWVGPVLAGDRLILANSQGEMMQISPETGEPIVKLDIGDSIRIAPIVAGRTLYLLADDATLYAYR